MLSSNVVNILTKERNDLQYRLDLINNLLDLDAPKEQTVLTEVGYAETLKKRLYARRIKKTSKKISNKIKGTLEKIDVKAKTIANKVWSRKYVECTNCETTMNKYKAKGLCSKCYKKQYEDGNNDYRFTCIDCDNEWHDAIPYDVNTLCPTCCSSHIVQK